MLHLNSIIWKGTGLMGGNRVVIGVCDDVVKRATRALWQTPGGFSHHYV